MVKEKSKSSNKLLTAVGIVLCIILVPMLVINCTLLIKGYTNENEVPSIAGVSPMIVLTDSMSGDNEDSFDGGSLIFIKTAAMDEVSIGDVVTFYDPDGNGTSVVTHRIVKETVRDGKKAFVTRGDANNTDDSTPITEDELIGKYLGVHIPGAGNVAMFMQTTPGLIVCVVLPLVLLIGYDAIRRAKYNKKHNQDKEQLLAELEEFRKLKAEKEAAEETSNI